MNTKEFQSQPGFSGDGEPLNEVPTLGQPFLSFVQSDLSKPIEITGRLKAKVMRWLPGINLDVKMYLWSKFADPSWNPNDYIMFENDEVSLNSIISSCGVLYSIADIKDDESLSVQAWKSADEEFRSLSDEEEEINFEEDPAIIAEVLCEETGKSENDPMKVHEALDYFKRQCCKRQKNCPKHHYLLGMGKLTLAGAIYEGVHIYVEPDYNEDQVDIISHNDDLYQKYGDKELSLQEQQDIISIYLRCLEETVDASFDAPFPLGKREFIHP